MCRIMCAICGFTIDQQPKPKVQEMLQRMNRAMKYRGLDDEGEWHDSNMALGHRRLSIIDLSPAGHQPMFLPDAGAVISYNGEISNFLDIRRELENRGRKFRSRTDTEVILHAYAEWGDGFLQKLNGMFAFAIWDIQKKRLLLARDRMGKKPLFYYHNGRRFIFASEMKAILLHPDVPREIDPKALALYLTYGYIPAPWTILKKVRKLCPGHYSVFQDGSFEEKSYWKIPLFGVEVNTLKEDALIEEFEALFEDAVRVRLISDVPLGAFLSGGVDSSAVVAMMAKIAKAPPKTFTIDFKEQGFSEAEDAAVVAKQLHTDHLTMQVSMSGLDILPKLVWHFDEPFGDSSAIPTFYVSKMACQEVKVILSGDGGDELFAGYMNYLRRDQYQKFLKVPFVFRQKLIKPILKWLPIGTPGKNTLYYLGHARAEWGQSEVGIYPYIFSDLISEDLKQQIEKSTNDALLWINRDVFHQFPNLSKLSLLQYKDARIYLPDDILVKVDRMSMANSLETRAPFLDYRLVEFAARLPEHVKIRNGSGKYLLRKWLKRYLSERIINKKKHGFAAPIKYWFRHSQNGIASDLLLSKRFQQRGLFCAESVKKVLHLHKKGKADFSTWIWLLINLELWFQIFMDSDTKRI